MSEIYNEKADQPFSHRIIEKNPESRGLFRVYLKINFMITALITLTIWAVLSVYWGMNSFECPAELLY